MSSQHSVSEAVASKSSSTGGKTKFLPLITDGGRVTVAPFVPWESLGQAFGNQDPAVERRELAEKAEALRALAADLIEQAAKIERSISLGTN